MSLTIEFYSAHSQELVTLFSESLASGDDLILYDTLQTYLKAEFPDHLLIPDDLDNLCQALKNEHPLIPSTFLDLCVEEVWNDGFGSESLTLLSHQYTQEIALFSEHEIQQVALQWAATFSLQEALEQRPAYIAVMQLRDVARDAVTKKKSLLFYLAGVPGFFEYLRNL